MRFIDYVDGNKDMTPEEEASAERILRATKNYLKQNLIAEVTPVNQVLAGPAVASFVVVLKFRDDDKGFTKFTLNLKHGGDVKANP